MARKVKVETGEFSPLSKTEDTELIVHRVVKDHFQKYINTVNLVLTGAALVVAIIGIGSYFWLVQQMVKSEIEEIRTELAIPKSTIVGMALINRDNSGAPKCPPGWGYLRSAEGRFVVGAMPEYVEGRQPPETLTLSNSEEILGSSNGGQPSPGYRKLENDDLPNLSASIGKTPTNAQPTSDNVVPYVAAYFCIKE